MALTPRDRFRLKGSIGGLWNFDLERTMSRDRYLDIWVPTNLQSKFRVDKRFKVVFDSVNLVQRSQDNPSLQPKKIIPISTSGALMNIWTRDQRKLATPHMLKAQAPGDRKKRISFALNKTWIEKETGFNFEVGRTYRISGSLGESCKFDSVLRETGYGEIHSFYVPYTHVKMFKQGEMYDVRIDEIEEISEESDHLARNTDPFWKWETVAAWTDTEGQYQATGSGARAVVSQDEREPLDGIHDFLLKEGIPNVVYDMGGGHYQLRTVGGVETLARFVLKTEPYIRTENKRKQIAKFKVFLRTRTTHENVHKRNARRILGL